MDDFNQGIYNLDQINYEEADVFGNPANIMYVPQEQQSQNQIFDHMNFKDQNMYENDSDDMMIAQAEEVKENIGTDKQ